MLRLLLVNFNPRDIISDVVTLYDLNFFTVSWYLCLDGLVLNILSSDFFSLPLFVGQAILLGNPVV